MPGGGATAISPHGGYSLKETFGHFAAEVERVLWVDDDKAGILPWIKSEGG